ncbi:MAG TPA: methyltransferase domain-containing protein [Mycobacteriales bacterium]|jgi:23S rRNA (guanine745-N1)-methyltransferase|nr:methyltransferase domain-containing protein [Mycobacteriales bacterium]
MLACPVCRSPLTAGESRFGCPNGHHFDRAKEGYVHLLHPGRGGRRPHGDDREMVAARRRFLTAGHYEPLRQALAELVPADGAQLDVGCGEGYYTDVLTGESVLGVDVSQPAVRMAAKAHRAALFAVASGAALPVLDGSVDVAVSVFSPVFPAELARVVRPGGSVIVVVPGAAHLDGLRALLYRESVPHDEQVPLDGVPGFTATTAEHVELRLSLDNEAVRDLVGMTPYRYSVRDAFDRIADVERLSTTAAFSLRSFRRDS